jgi:hypothetical protein
MTISNAHLLACFVAVSIAGLDPAEANICARTHRANARTEVVARDTRVGDVEIAPGGEIVHESVVDDDCSVTGTVVSAIRLKKGGRVCGVSAPGVNVGFENGLDPTLPLDPRRFLKLYAGANATIRINGLTVRTDNATLLCTSNGVEVSYGTLAKPGRVFGVDLRAGDSFQGERGCLSSLDLVNNATVDKYMVPATARITFVNCHPQRLQRLGDKTMRFTHAGVTCIIDHRSHELALHPTTGRIHHCQVVEPFQYEIAGAKRTVTGGFTGVTFYDNGAIEDAELAGSVFFGVLLANPRVNLAPDGRLVRVSGVLREPHVFNGLACRANQMSFNGSGSVERCDRDP